MNNLAVWQFWIDVGGTFTDCIARDPDGQTHRTKVLSSGIAQGTISGCPAKDQLADSQRIGDPSQFWTGFQIRIRDPQAAVIFEARVTQFDTRQGVLQLDRTLPAGELEGFTYELFSEVEAPILAIRYLMEIPVGTPIPPVSVRLGTTRGTNALLTRSGARVGLVTTAGFADLLKIGNQDRPRLFELAIQKPEPLFESVVEIEERVSCEGDVLQPLDEQTARQRLHQLRDRGIQSLAICLLHGYRHPAHELQLAEIARQLGFADVSLSSQVAPLIKMVSRGETTVLDAYLNPVLCQYLTSLQRELGPGSDLRLMTSAGGLVHPDRFSGKDSILSGPAGGVVGFSQVAQAAGFARSIGFDMGGTSTDVSRFDGRYALQHETTKAGVRIVSEMLAIETVAAGGGSICRFDGTRFLVGPESATSDPGPACYGRGGPLTVTDLNVYSGKVVSKYFPFPLNHHAIEDRLAHVAEQVEQATGQRFSLIELAAGFLQVANANMVNAIRSISVAEGYDPRDYVLVGFGGAAPQHVCEIAGELQMTEVLIHPDAGVLSALGMGLAEVRRHEVVGVYQSYDAAQSRLPELFSSIEAAAIDHVIAEGVPRARIESTRSLELRYLGTDSTLTIIEPSNGDYASQFQREHRRRYGYVQQRPLEIVAARVEAVGRSSKDQPAARRLESERAVRSQETTTAHFGGQACETAILFRSELEPGDSFSGPSIVIEPTSTIVVDPGWQAHVLTDHQLLITRSAPREAPNPPQIEQDETGEASVPESADPTLLEVFNNQFTSIATQMGITLRNTSTSVNVKERLDFSCAIFTSTGDLVVNAPHIPVHLGAMSETVKQLIAREKDILPGDVFVTNDPYQGGSHLPDVTVITPVHDSTGTEIRFFTASRAHHGEIGGITPGSMPPFSKNLAEEGVLIRCMRIVEAGQPRLDQLEHFLRSATYPSRKPEENLADISAQIAANQQGVHELLMLVQRHRWPVVRAYMQFIQQAASRKTRAAIGQISDGTNTFADHLDDGSRIQVTVTVDQDRLIIDFSGTSDVHPGNLNANRAIVSAAVLYCLRCLIDEDIPLNQGVFEPVQLILPQGLLNPPAHDDVARCPAMAGGNVETSQRIVDVVLGALGLAAASQGTMNNLLFGDSSFGYYETICGGSGATPHANGTDAVHTHMTNTRLTDPEVLEQRFPVRLSEFSIRRHSGGGGRFRGGNGVVRRLQFLRPLDVSLLSQRRGDYPPFGMAGGDSGKIGQAYLHRRDGHREALTGRTQISVAPGDLLTIETPGGGGYGPEPTQPDRP